MDARRAPLRGNRVCGPAAPPGWPRPRSLPHPASRWRTGSASVGPRDDGGVGMTSGQPDHEVIVIGAGFSGIGAAIKLDQAGFPDYLVIEKDDGVGGAWHANTYPGVAVDIPSFSYSFSF